MGKGTLTTSSRPYMINYVSSSSSAATAKMDSPEQSDASQFKKLPEFNDEMDFRLPIGKKYIGVVIVNCKIRPGDPTFGFWIVAVENPLGINVSDQDIVDFEYTSWFTGRITQKTIDPCANPKLEVVFEEVTPIKRPTKKKVPIKAAKKASKKKGGKK